MNTSPVLQNPPKPSSLLTYLSEIFVLKIQQPQLISFRLSPEVDRELGNRFSWRFSQQFPEVVAIWENGYFWVLDQPNQPMRSKEEWREALVNIEEELKEDISDRTYSIQWVQQPKLTASILAQLAIRVLQIRRPFSSDTIWSDTNNRVEVKREVEFWAETFEWQNVTHPAVVLTMYSPFVFKGTLADFYENHPYRQDAKKLLIGLKVRNIEKGSSATIIALAGTIGERREEILKKATGAVSKQALEEAPDEQPVVSVQFGKDKKPFDYAMTALKPCVTEKTADRFDVKYGDLLKETKIPYKERKQRLASYKQQAEKALAVYGFQLGDSINSRRYRNLFLELPFKLEETKLLFGNGVIGKRGAVLKGLSKGGAYRRHPDYLDPSRPIRFTVLNLCNLKPGSFFAKVEERLKHYGFSIKLVNNFKGSVNSANMAEERAKVEKEVDDLITVPTDIVLTFLPQSDRNADNSDDGSFYSLISSRLLRRGLSSQVIYEDTLKDTNNYDNILNQVIPGILAKLGNLPFILAEPLGIADYFMGLDISRAAKKKGVGSRNVCASVRLYGKQGDFIRYRLEDAMTEGEEIDKRTLERFLPAADLSGKTVLIYRDGHFCGGEVKYLRERAKAIGSNFILVECIKSKIPRLYNYEESVLKAPTKGLALRLSSNEVILVTTQLPSEKMGLSNPVRLKVLLEEGQQVSIESLVETTLKLTLLHHGALREPRLAVPLYGSDRIAYRRLQGISPGALDGDKQFWL
ncbi:Piwi domain-containing protein [Kamptonema sp. UHCC 0994]|uniref:Piwi domain-containing protein n=1 Tax=Kamptonema sp. UHCC 0994 TaxID=3031329 RepID=UPI0023BA3B80|nr:Piwi domain-containing protein [Kamptonema sp. UHCC 0994]MDF0553407.1 Piwi domain-containing protein [Kamptonema sp. UHCC 0994]